MHEAYGGVVPELASRDHVRRVVPLVAQVLREAGIGMADLDGIAYTQGPGLAGALLVGASVATAMAYALRIRTIPVHHLEGHLLSPLLSERRPTSRSSRCSSPAATASCSTSRASGITDCSATRSTMPPARHSTRPRSCWPAVPRRAGARAACAGGHAGGGNAAAPDARVGRPRFQLLGLKTAVLTLVRKETHGDQPASLSMARKADIALEFEARWWTSRREGAGGSRANGAAAPRGGGRRWGQPAVARAARRGLAGARLRSVLPGSHVLHRQRRDDRARRRTEAGRGAPVGLHVRRAAPVGPGGGGDGSGGPGRTAPQLSWK